MFVDLQLLCHMIVVLYMFESLSSTKSKSRYKNLTYAEISEEMGISINTVKLYQKKALAQLRLVLKEYLSTSLD